ncbi:hypothetical protein MKX03_035498 [Papaver bracteatum]|nr:hypothetical protein MKX03_035498 [Papaver bracteatum]
MKRYEITKMQTLTARLSYVECNQPKCETRKWTVLGEVRVGIFSKQDIPVGAEPAYDYNFEWFGGAKVRCLCGAISCSGLLGEKSRGFQILGGEYPFVRFVG